jgi:hypothetical protein
MKRILLFLAVAMFFISDGFAQATFSTGAMDVNVNQYGRIRLFTPDGTRHLQRASVLVGVSESAVFDYTNDAEELEPTVLIENPLLSDFEIRGAYDNSYSGAPPDVIVRLSAYGWTDAAYTVVKFTVINNETTPMTAMVGLDVIPEINQEYGFDTVTFNADAQVIRFHRGLQENMGMKLLSESLTSLYSFEWYDGYPVDSDYWQWMKTGILQPQYASTTADGPVTITSQADEVIEPGLVTEVFYAMALGADEATMLANIAAAEQKYINWFAGVDDNGPAAGALRLGQNYPNPFEGSTTISYQLPEDGFVSLKVYNSIGQEVAALVNSEMPAGNHTAEFISEDLEPGIYFCRLSFGGEMQTLKMSLVR